MSVVVVLWLVLAVMVYKVLTVERDYVEYDPFAILELDPVSLPPPPPSLSSSLTHSPISL